METRLGNNNIGSNNSLLGAVFLVVGWLIFLGLVAFLIQESIYKTKTQTLSQSYAGTKITLYRDQDSHFRIKGSINGIAVTFLIDTGATSIAVSENIAQAAKLKKLSTINTETASGTSMGYFTTIDKLNIDNIELDHLSAIIVPSMEDDLALLGMNALKNFSIQQEQETMIISVPNGLQP